jgi:hypothetical protein
VDGGATYSEYFHAWKHLANAGLVEGTYSGIAGTASNFHHVLGVNAPRSKISNAGYGFSYVNFPGDLITYAMNYGNMFWFGAEGGHRPQGGVLSPEEAWNIDTKMDDGRPAYGNVIMRSDAHSSGWGEALSCTTSTSANDFTGNYKLVNSAKSCALMVKTGY